MSLYVLVVKTYYASLTNALTNGENQFDSRPPLYGTEIKMKFGRKNKFR